MKPASHRWPARADRAWMRIDAFRLTRCHGSGMLQWPAWCPVSAQARRRRTREGHLPQQPRAVMLVHLREVCVSEPPRLELAGSGMAASGEHRTQAEVRAREVIADARAGT